MKNILKSIFNRKTLAYISMAILNSYGVPCYYTADNN